MQLVSDDALTEALESDHLALQNMSGSKYVQVSPTCTLAVLYRVYSSMDWEVMLVKRS